MRSFATTDFRADLGKITVPTLVLHGDSDAIVPFEGSGQHTQLAVEGSDLALLVGAPHGCNVSHPEEFNQALIAFLDREGRVGLPFEATVSGTVLHPRN